VPAVLEAVLTFAATEGEESSKTAFYALGGLLVVFALAVAAIGISRHETWPGSRRTARGVMGLAALLVAAVLASAVLTS
jgi:hypothetical protein